MRSVIVGEYYTYDNGDPQSKLIIFTTDKGKYLNEDIEYFDTITLGSYGKVFQTDFETDFFNSEHVRLSTIEEIKELRSYSPVNEEWLRKEAARLIKEAWGINNKPNIILDPSEPLEKPYFGMYDSKTKSIMFRSELLVLLSFDDIRKIILHELCHWYLHTTGQNWSENDQRFIDELNRLNIENTHGYFKVD